MTAAAIPSSTSHVSSVVDADGATRVLSVETVDYLVLTQDRDAPLGNALPVPETASLVVYGDVVSICGPLVLPGQTVKIVCRRLETRPDSKGQPAAIVVDGPDGTDGKPYTSGATAGHHGANGTGESGWFAKDHPELNGQKGASGTPGKPGGEILVACGSVADDLQLTLSAKGGRGGNGARGQDGGDGGTGGNGRDAYTDTGTQLKHLFDPKNDIIKPTKGGNGGDGGKAGDGGDGGRAGSGGNVTVAILHTSADDVVVVARPVESGRYRSPGFTLAGRDSATPRIDVDVNHGAYGSPAGPGSPGGAGAPGSGGQGMVLTELASSGISELFGGKPVVLAECGSAPDGSWGSPGGGGVAGTLVGDPANTGVGAYHLGDPAAGALFEGASVSQLRMLYGAACTHFLAAGDGERPDEQTQARDLLAWLQDVLTRIADDEEAADKRTLGTSANGLLLAMASGGNYFGEKASYVPRASLDFLESNIKDTLATLEELEESSRQYFAALQNAEETKDHLQLVLKQTDGAVAYWTTEIGKIDDQLASILVDVEALEQEIPAARDALTAASDKLGDAVMQAVGLTLEDLLDTLEQLSFTSDEGPQAFAMMGAQGGKLYNKAVNYVTDDSGESYRKDYITHTLKLFGRDVSTLAEGWHEAENERLTLDDANAYRLVMEQQSFDKLCDMFFQSLPEAAAAKDAMDSLVELVQHRNQRIADYNGGIGAREDLGARIADAKKHAKTLQQELASNASPDLPARTAFVSGLYEQTKAHCIRELYLASRAHEFWALEPCPLFSDVLGNRHPADIDHDALSAAADSLRKRLEQAVEKLKSPPEQFTELAVKLSDVSPLSVERLRKTGVCTFRLHAPTKATSATENPFAGLADVRVTTVRAWLVGARMKESKDGNADDLVRVKLTHLGNEDVAPPVPITEGRRQRPTLSFSHESVDLTFRYVFGHERTPKALRGHGTEDGTITDPQGKSEYSQIGPFARWRVEVSRQLNPSLDLSGLEDVVLEFSGGNRTFA